MRKEVSTAIDRRAARHTLAKQRAHKSSSIFGNGYGKKGEKKRERERWRIKKRKRKRKKARKKDRKVQEKRPLTGVQRDTHLQSREHIKVVRSLEMDTVKNKKKKKKKRKERERERARARERGGEG